MSPPKAAWQGNDLPLTQTGIKRADPSSPSFFAAESPQSVGASWPFVPSIQVDSGDERSGEETRAGRFALS